MGKKRRERDRPKAAHDALYNPNKRVLLSYESDEEEGEIGAAENPLLERPVTSYLTQEQLEVNNATAPHQSAAGEVKDEPDKAEDDDVFEEHAEGEEQQHSNEAGAWRRPTGRNALTGQWAAIGSLSYSYEDGEEEEEFESEEEEAMAYLRAVRSERQAMPDFFVAEQTYSHDELYDNGTGDTRGRFEDGAYIAAPISGPTLPESAKTQVEPQEAFARALKERFLQQRQHLRTPASLTSSARTDARSLTSLPKKDNQKYGQWLKAIPTTPPLPDQLRLMEQAGVMRVLNLIQERFLLRESDVSPMVSAWIWSLLARLDEVGNMDSDRVALLRDFGKRAVLVQLSFRDPETAAELERVADIENGNAPQNTTNKKPAATPNGDASQTNATSQMSKLEPDELDDQRANTRATLDTILILVGDVFGQKDLLEFREPWSISTEEGESPDERPNGISTSAIADA